MSDFVSLLSLSTLKHLVAQAGAEWVGIQETVPPHPDLLLFNSPHHKSTLAIRLESDMVLADIVPAIQKRLSDSGKQFSQEKKDDPTRKAE